MSDLGERALKAAVAFVEALEIVDLGDVSVSEISAADERATAALAELEAVARVCRAELETPR